MDAYVIGRLSADLYPLQINTPLEEVRTFERFVGGFAGKPSDQRAGRDMHRDQEQRCYAQQQPQLQHAAAVQWLHEVTAQRFNDRYSCGPTGR